MTNRVRVLILAVSAAALVVAVVLSLLVGVHTYAWTDLTAALSGEPGANTDVLRGIRVPRTALAIIVGVALSLAGTLTQSITRNPLADPGMLGVTAGAGLAVTVAAAVGVAGSQAGQMAFAFLGAAVTGIVVYAIGQSAPLRLVLAGVALSAVLLGVGLGLRLMFPEAFDAARTWTVGSIAGREQTPIALPLAVMLVGIAASVLVARPLGAMALGDDVARAMGVRVPRLQLGVFAIVTLLAGTATAAVGPLAFIGLIVPSMARRPAGGSLPWMLAFTAVWGALILVLADVLARVLLPTGEVPLSVVTAFLGGFALIVSVRQSEEAT